jgi:hypothetical protein
VIDERRLDDAARKHDVPLTRDQVRELTKLIRETEIAYAHHIADESLDDISGAGGAGRLEAATIEGRRILCAAIAIVHDNFTPPAATGAADPMIDAARNHLEPPTEGDADYALRVGMAARRVADRVRIALEGANPDDIQLLKNAVIAKRDAGRPAQGLELRRRFIRAVYFFWFHEGGDRTVSIGNVGIGTPPSALVRLAVATCEAARFEVQPTTVRSVLNEYRRNVLRVGSAAAGILEDEKPELAHFQDEKLAFFNPIDRSELYKRQYMWWLAPPYKPRSQ